MRGKKKEPARPAPMSRIQLAKELGCGLTSIDRLVAEGLSPAGTRGKAKTYDPVAARRLARKLAPREAAGADVMRQVWADRAADVRERADQLRAEWVDEAGVLARWRVHVEAVEPATEDWPRLLAVHVAGVTDPEAARLLPWHDEPRVRRLFVNLEEERPEVTSTFYAVLLPPASRPARVAPPATLTEARTRCQQDRVAYQALKSRIRRGHRRREAVEWALADAVERARRTFIDLWLGEADRVAGDLGRARKWGERCRDEMLAALSARRFQW